MQFVSMLAMQCLFALFAHAYPTSTKGTPNVHEGRSGAAHLRLSLEAASSAEEPSEGALRVLGMCQPAQDLAHHQGVVRGPV